ncbi:MAG: hypothetical protein AAF890_00330 [Pseudomonadota bacterium]
MGHLRIFGDGSGRKSEACRSRLATWTSGALLGALVLSGCQSASLNSGLPSNSAPPPPLAAAPDPALQPAVSPVDGFWEPTSGGVTYKTQFKDGQFITRSNEGGLILAKGSYTTSPEGMVQLQWVSGAYKETVTADCNRPTADTLVCTPSRGSQLSLRRAASTT